MLGRTEEEIESAHDLLAQIIMGEVQIGIDAEDLSYIEAASDVLCWALGHRHNDAFMMNLASLQDAAKNSGAKLRSGVVLDTLLDDETGQKHYIPDNSSTMLKSSIGPPMEHCCKECSAPHDPAWPHNYMTLYYQINFEVQHGRPPCWVDAAAHCSSELQRKWFDTLEQKGININQPIEEVLTDEKQDY